jgi:hypothetical protein
VRIKAGKQLTRCLRQIDRDEEALEPHETNVQLRQVASKRSTQRPTLN